MKSKKLKLLIVVAPYYKDICEELVAGAREVIEASGAKHERIDVPGALEIPAAIALAAKSKFYDAYVALGCVMRGETIHYEIVGGEASRAIMDLTLHGLCIGNGILTVENDKQAWARANRKEQNIGAGAATAALSLLSIKTRFTQKS
jgi:6,7-dimethyl-8-ribityllumazine synthase